MPEAIADTDHADAWDLAHFRQENSNLARCYIDLRNTVRVMLDLMPLTSPEIRKLRDIEATAADSAVKRAVDG